MKRYQEEDDYMEEEPVVWREEQEFGCPYCFDNKAKKEIDIYFFDRANNMRLCSYCPACGRHMEGENV